MANGNGQRDPGGRNTAVAVGIDVGGDKKGFHAVALAGSSILGTLHNPDASEVAAWCVAVGARAIGIDAPSQWGSAGRTRSAERQLLAERLSCFVTPSREAAVTHKSNFYGWMLNGERLYRALAATHPPLTGPTLPACFETFPHAIACLLAERSVRARERKLVALQLLRERHIAVTALTNVDLVDAALCAVMAQELLCGRYRLAGDYADGVVVLPR